ncbi:hypothetical protein HNY73_017792 [Argiope bruennichi]|uniref:Uncharacterized protein n=1 Tax=Argiope bruennichi TaxID=94029 RepID=A0A8T0EDZ5_ARGBR|nr:hypothetical protein HNY73_017792 [Argiope bruennichi]
MSFVFGRLLFISLAGPHDGLETAAARRGHGTEPVSTVLECMQWGGSPISSPDLVAGPDMMDWNCCSDDEAMDWEPVDYVEDMEWEEVPLPPQVSPPLPPKSKENLPLKVKVPAPLKLSAPNQKERLTLKTKVPQPTKAKAPETKEQAPVRNVKKALRRL